MDSIPYELIQLIDGFLTLPKDKLRFGLSCKQVWIQVNKSSINYLSRMRLIHKDINEITYKYINNIDSVRIIDDKIAIYNNSKHTIVAGYYPVKKFYVLYIFSNCAANITWIDDMSDGIDGNQTCIVYEDLGIYDLYEIRRIMKRLKLNVD